MSNADKKTFCAYCERLIYSDIDTMYEMLENLIAADPDNAANCPQCGQKIAGSKAEVIPE